jgi:cell division protein FtsQ
MRLLPGSGNPLDISTDATLPANEPFVRADDGRSRFHLARWQHEIEEQRTSRSGRDQAAARAVRRRRLFRLRDWPMALAATVGALTFLGLTDFGRDTRGPGSLTRSVDDIAAHVGLGLDEVSVTGHKFTRLDEVFDAIDLHSVRVGWQADVAAIKARLEQLPWIAQASVGRSGIGSLSVTLIERRPAAIWTTGSNTDPTAFLIDSTGRRLGPILATAPSDLLRITGEGAVEKLPDLVALLALDRDLQATVASAELISQRRWMLRLGSGHVVYLPHEGAGAALVLASKLLAQSSTTTVEPVGAREFDLSVAGRIAVRPVARPAADGAAKSQLSNGS